MSLDREANRYQRQGLAVRCARWLHHMPQVPFRFAYRYAAWAAQGFPDTHNIGLTWRNLWRWEVGAAQSRMEWYYTLEELHAMWGSPAK